MTRVGVVDIGTNTMLLLVAERGADGRPRAVLDLCRFARLGEGLDRSGVLAPAAIERGLAIAREYRVALDSLGVAAPHVIATQALREAGNASAFTAPAAAILGAPVTTIPGEREAELALAAARATFPELAAVPYLVVDVGGGSTEIVKSDGGGVSLPIGAVRLTERHLTHDPPTPEERAALAADIDRHLVDLDLPERCPVVATAGTATTLASVELALPAYDPDAVTGIRLEPAGIERLLASLFALTVAERRVLPGMVVERADVLPAGVAILAAVARRVAAPALIVSDRGIRWGLAVELLATHR